jgi:hypothetical protein
MRRALAIFLVATSATLAAQPYTNTLELRLGPEHSMRQDLLLSPMVHTDVSLVNFALRWEQSKKMQHFVQLHFRLHNPTLVEPYTFYNTDSTTATTYPNYWTLVDVDYAIGKVWPVSISENLIGDLSHRTTVVSAGAILTNNVNATPLSTGGSSTFAYFANFSLGGWVRIAKETPRAHLSATLNLPLFGITARSPYLLNDDEFIQNVSYHNGFVTFFAYLVDGHFNTLNRLFNPSLNVRYMKAVGKRWYFTVNYDFEYLRHNKPLALTSFQSSLMIGMAFRHGSKKSSE